MSAAPAAQPAASAPAAKAIPPKAFAAASLGFVALTAVVLGSVYTPLLSVLFAPAPPVVEPVSDSKIKAREREFADRLASAGDKVIKRSPFHPPVVKEEPEPPVPPTYGGPTIIGVAGGAVYFNDYASPSSVKRVNLGESDGEVTVIKIDAPWSVTLGWKGGEFVVPMLDRQPVKFDANTSVKDMLFQTTPAAVEPDHTRDRPRRQSRN